jgi:hypothetical protein
LDKFDSQSSFSGLVPLLPPGIALAPHVSPLPTGLPALAPHFSLASHPSLEAAFSSSAAQSEVACLDVPPEQEDGSLEAACWGVSPVQEDGWARVVCLDVPQEQEDDSPEVALPVASEGQDSLELVRLDVPPGQEDDSPQVVRWGVPPEQEVGWPEAALPDGSPGLRGHSASPRWQAARQDAHSAPRRVSQHAWLPAERAWADSPA